ncbi:WD repeat protein [Stagonosporopsis vannaccii]|nr:WD repeat protein [Stagonosporopsis vannaccii]
MSPTLHHESTRVPVTALASCGALLIVAEGPFLRFYHAKSSRYIASKRVFKAQAVHGICVYAEELDHVAKLVVWGGRLVCAIRIGILPGHHGYEPSSLNLSNVVRAPDWILDLAPRLSSLDDEDAYDQGTCAAVTAHNALLELKIQWQSKPAHTLRQVAIFQCYYSYCSPKLNITELTTSSRSILYSAHLLWESSGCILVAAGTAFGEIMYWSWNKSAYGRTSSYIHQVFLGHEGSIFDVRISKDLKLGSCGNLKRVIASCSDDRTIRLWDVSDVNVNLGRSEAVDPSVETQRTRHTGFSIAATETQSEDSNCLAIGWGHTSRVWRIRFLDSSPYDDGSLALLSAGEDATSRTWELVANTKTESVLPCMLQQIDCAAYHNGKNMWSTTTYRQAAGSVHVLCGAADSKLTSHPLLGVGRCMQGNSNTSAEYSVQDLLPMGQASMTVEKTRMSGKAAKKGDSIRSYCFILDKTFLLITNFGKILVKSFSSGTNSTSRSGLTGSTLVDQLDGLSGYSTCASVSAYGVAFLAGANGGIYMYCAADSSLQSVHTVTGKVGSLFARDISSAIGQKRVALLVTLVGQRQAQLLFINVATTSPPTHLEAVSMPLSDILTGSTVTSMTVIDSHSENMVLSLGFRRGSIGLYTISRQVDDTEICLRRVIDKAHGDETVTAMQFQASAQHAAIGYLYSVGRDGRLAVHWIDLTKNISRLVHNLVLPFGPNIEDLYFHDKRLLLHGFSSKRWVLYDITSEEEIMGIETGGAHRSWAFQPTVGISHPEGGTLVWTRTSSLHISSQQGPNHEVLRSGGHGREIKAVAVTLPAGNSRFPEGHCRLIATGAEDTDIRIFQYVGGELVCRTTLRKHTTGIQHLQWSDDGEYLFSSAGSEEFYVWRVRALEGVIDIGVVCEFVYTPESEFSDLRITSFDVTRRESAFTIAMVFSDSSVKTYRYDPTLAIKWKSLSKGVYFTSCLTQCILLSPTTLLTAGTDGHAVVWPLSAGVSEQALIWRDPTRLHQNASKTMSSYTYSESTSLIVSGGDDGALAFLLVHTTGPDLLSAAQCSYATSPMLVNRAHCSAVTACAIVNIQSRIYVLTSGNDEWVRLWEVIINITEDSSTNQSSLDKLTIKRLSKVKSSVADISSMVALDNDGVTARVLLCGVGMEVIRLEVLPEERDH